MTGRLSLKDVMAVDESIRAKVASIEVANPTLRLTRVVELALAMTFLEMTASPQTKD